MWGRRKDSLVDTILNWHVKYSHVTQKIAKTILYTSPPGGSPEVVSSHLKCYPLVFSGNSALMSLCVGISTKKAETKNKLLIRMKTAHLLAYGTFFTGKVIGTHAGAIKG